MYFLPEVAEQEFPSLMRRFLEITGRKPWTKRLTWLEAALKKDVPMSAFLQERFQLELAFSTMHRKKKLTGRYPRKNLTADQLRFLSFVAMVVRCHDRVNPHGKSRLRGMLLDSLKSDYGLGPMAYEMKIAAHLLTRGFDLTLHDLETGGGYDYLAVKDDLQIEVECKFVTGDIGRQIHLKRLYQFGEYFTTRLKPFLDRLHGGIFIRVTIPRRLQGQESQHASITQQVFRAIGVREGPPQVAESEVSVSEFALEGSPFSRISPQFLLKEDVVQFLSQCFGMENRNMLILFRPRRHAVIVVLQSSTEDRVLAGIHRQLKDSASRQLSGTLPGVLCCHLADLDEKELLSLQYKGDRGIGLDYMTSDLINRRPQLLAVTYTAPGSIVHEPMITGDSDQESQRERGVAYTVRNPNHPVAKDSRYSLY